MTCSTSSLHTITCPGACCPPLPLRAAPAAAGGGLCGSGLPAGQRGPRAHHPRHGQGGWAGAGARGRGAKARWAGAGGMGRQGATISGQMMVMRPVRVPRLVAAVRVWAGCECWRKPRCQQQPPRDHMALLTPPHIPAAAPCCADPVALPAGRRRGCVQLPGAARALGLRLGQEEGVSQLRQALSTGRCATRGGGGSRRLLPWLASSPSPHSKASQTPSALAWTPCPPPSRLGPRAAPAQATHGALFHVPPPTRPVLASHLPPPHTHTHFWLHQRVPAGFGFTCIYMEW